MPECAAVTPDGSVYVERCRPLARVWTQARRTSGYQGIGDDTFAELLVDCEEDPNAQSGASRDAAGHRPTPPLATEGASAQGAIKVQL